MTVTRTQRLGLALYSSGSDPWPGRTGWNELMGLLEGQTAEWAQGTIAARPTAGVAGRMYWATDTKRKYWDDGSAWTEESPVGGGGTPQRAKIGAAGSEGTSRVAARADHTHPITAPAAPAALVYGGPGTAGTSDTPARADHTHPMPALPVRAVPFDFSHRGGGKEGAPIVVAPGNSGWVYGLSYNVEWAGAAHWSTLLTFESFANAAVEFDVYVSGVIHRSGVRFHNRNRPGVHTVALDVAYASPADADVTVQVLARVDSWSTADLAFYESSGYFAVIT
jgi:hypothetical protein